MADKYSMYLKMEIEKVDSNGVRTPTGHEVVFRAMPTDIESTLKGWYLTLQHLAGCCGDGDIGEKAAKLLSQE